MLKGLKNPNIVRIFDFGFDEALGRFYFTQELVEGRPVTAFAREKGKLPRLQNLFLQALQGLAYLHGQDVIHGDIKPDNLLVEEKKGSEPLLKMIDFGISHPEWVGTAGTPGYLAPEKILKMGSDARADLYSLGVVFYDALTGKDPFLRPSPGETLQAQLNFFPPAATTLRPEIDPVLSELLEAMLKKNPRLRIASAESCIRFLETRGLVDVGLEGMRDLPSYWMGRKERLDQAKEFLASAAASPEKNKLLVVSGERGMGKETLLAEMKYEAELAGLEVLDWGAKPTRARSVQFLKIVEPGKIPALGQIRQGLQTSSLVLTADSSWMVELKKNLASLAPQWLTLRPLTKDEIEDYLRNITRNEVIPAPFLNALLRLSQGHPQPLQEALRQLLKDPLIVDASGKWNLAVFAEAEPSLEQLGLSEDSLLQVLEGKRITDPAERWRLEFQRAEQLAKAGQLEESLKRLGKIEGEIPKVFSQEARLPNHALLLEKRGWIYSKQRRFTEAREAFASALSFLKELENPPKILELRLRNFLAFLNLQEGKIAESIQEFEASSRESETLPLGERRHVTNNELGQAYLMHGETQKAITQLREDLQFFSKLAAPHFLMKVHYNLAEALVKAAHYPEAMEAYREVARIARRERDWEYLLRAYNGQGNVASLQKDPTASLDYYQRSLGLAEYLRDYLSAATVAQNRGVILSEAGRLEEALHDLELSRRLLSKVSPSSHSRYLMARAILELGEAHRKKKNFPMAANCFTEALNRSEEDPNLKPFKFFPLASLARLALDQGDVPAFRELYPKLVHLAQTEEERGILAEFLSRAPVDPREGWDLGRVASEVSPQRSMIIPGAFPQETLQQILKVNRALITEHNPEALFRKILQYATELSGAESALLLELSEDGSLVVREAFNTEVDAGLKEISHQVAQRVLNSGQSVVTHDALVDQGFNQFQSVVSLHLKSIACIPVKVHQKTIGLLYLTHRYKIGLFTPETVNALEAFGDQAGLALQNSRYLRQLENQNQDLSSRLNDAEGEIDRLRSDLRLKVKNPYPKILGKSRALVEILKLMDRISDTNLSVLIVGETGSGKELIARSIHESSRRAKGPFVAVNCGAIPENLIESELFGYKSGAFTGATRDKKGLIEEAHGGTLFLDEIAELPLNTQVKLLRVLQEREVQHLGDNKLIPVDIRILSATHRDLEIWMQTGHFREDLYYRIAQMQLTVPALREKREDIPLLSEHFLAESAKDLSLSKPPRLAKDLLASLMQYDWPGHVRELENFLRTAAAFAERGVIHPGTLPEFLVKKLHTARPVPVAVLTASPVGGKAPPSAPDPEWRWENFEAALYAKALLKHQMNCEKAAEDLGVGIATVYLKMRKYGLKAQAHKYESVQVPNAEGASLAEFKSRLIRESYQKNGESPYAVAKQLGLNVGTVYRYLEKA